MHLNLWDVEVAAPILAGSYALWDVLQSVCKVVCLHVEENVRVLVRVLVNYLGNVIIVQISVKGDVMVLVTEHVSLCQQEWIL